MQSLIGNTNLNLDTPGEIINNFNQTYSQINELKFKNDERKRKEIEDDLLEQSKYFIQVGRDLIKQGVPASKVPWAFKSPRTVMDGLKQNYDSYKQTIDTENQNLAWNNFINKYAGAGEFNRQEWEQDPISVEKRLLENKAKKGEINSSEIDEALYGGNQTKTKTQTPQTQISVEDVSMKGGAVAIPQNPPTYQPQAVQTNFLATTSYTIQPNDNLTKIAQNNNISIAELLKLNPEIKKNPDLIIAGKTLNIPDKNISATATTPTQSTITQTQNTPKVAPSQTQTNITGAAPADSNIEKTIKDENDINLMINDLKIKQENLLEISKKLGEKGLGSGRQADFISNKLSDLQNKIIELQLYDINQKQKIELNQLKQNTATAIEKIEQRYNFKLLEKEVLNRQKLSELKLEEKEKKTKYQPKLANTKIVLKTITNLSEAAITKLDEQFKILDEAKTQTIKNKAKEEIFKIYDAYGYYLDTTDPEKPKLLKKSNKTQKKLNLDDYKIDIKKDTKND